MHLTAEDLERGLEEIRRSPAQQGELKWIVCRPRNGERQVLQSGTLDQVEGLVGDNWRARGSARTADGSADPNTQLTIMNARAIGLVARQQDRWHLAGDQLFIDLDLSAANLPPGTQLAVGSAVIEITAQPHTGCKKFAARFGDQAFGFVNSPVGRELQLRGVNARVVRPGAIRVGDLARKIGPGG